MKKIKSIFKKMVRIPKYCLVAIMRVCPIKKNRIYFISNSGNKFNCNPKAYFEYIYNNHHDEFEFYYVANNDSVKSLLPSDVKTASYQSLKDYYYLLTSKYIVNNFRFHKHFHKRKNQIYIQTWHGSPLPYKAVEKAAENKLGEYYIKCAKNDGKYIDIFTVGSKDIKQLYEKYFWCDGEFLNIGTPRYDALINSTEKDIKNAKKQLNIPLNKTLIVFAPTFKNNKNFEYDLIDNKKIIKFFKDSFNKDVIIGYRFHPNIAKTIDESKIINAINLTNINDSDIVVMAADYIISDFSSIITDGMLINKRCICYSKDFDDYVKNDREIWIDFNKFPLKLCKNIEEIFEQFCYYEKNGNINFSKILSEKYEISEKGNASEILYKAMINYNKGEIK